MSIIDSSTNKVRHKLDMQLGEYTVSGPDEFCFSPDGDLAYLIYCGAVPIDSPGPDSTSVIAVIDASTHQKIGVITLDEWAGAGMMVFAP